MRTAWLTSWSSQLLFLVLKIQVVLLPSEDSLTPTEDSQANLSNLLASWSSQILFDLTSTEDSLNPTEDSLADLLLVLINSVGPHYGVDA